MTAALTRPTEVAALADGLHATGSVRVPLPQLWALWAAVAPRLVGDSSQAAALAAALNDLANRGALQLPTTAWDTSTTPPLPRFVIIPAARRAPRDQEWIRFPWRHELGWVASLPTLSDARLRDLIAINDWLTRTNGGNVPVVPVRYRSVEILGDEKCLDGLVRTNLFGSGRLTLNLLACVRIPAPLPAVTVGPGPDVLVVENSDTYWVTSNELRKHRSHRIGAVAWGSGKAFPSQVSALGVDIAGRGPVTGTVWYWGDLDPPGLAIAAAAAAAATAAQLPHIRPAIALWEGMADRPIQDSGDVNWSTASGREWLGEPLWDRLAPVRDANARVAQESLPASMIRDWATSTAVLQRTTRDR